MKTIFLIPGLGADHRVFDFLKLSGYQCQVISWIEPFRKESIEDYAGRLSSQIKSNNPIIIGVSFGGMMAIEIGKHINTEKIILISSARTKHEIPVYVRWLGKLGLHKLTPESWLKKPGNLMYYFFGVKKQAEKKLLKEIVRDTNLQFLRWAIDKIVSWENKIVPEGTICIHGSNDKLLPLTQREIIISGGSHFMIVSKGKEISEKLNQLLAN